MHLLGGVGQGHVLVGRGGAGSSTCWEGAGQQLNQGNGGE